MWEKLTINTALNGDRLKACHLRPGTKQGCPLSIYLFSKGLGGMSKQRGMKNKLRTLKLKKK